MLQTEVQILSEIKYEFIVQMREYHVIDDAWYIRMELLEVRLSQMSPDIKLLFRKAIFSNICGISESFENVTLQVAFRV